MTRLSGLTPEQVEEYLYRSYTRVDGLWFVMAEERLGVNAALTLDEAVWKALPKIQARLLQEQLHLTADLAGLTAALQAKLTLDRYQFEFKQTSDGMTISISRCPWHDLICRSGREHLAERVGGVICAVELPAFARQFNCSCSPPATQRLCRNSGQCSFQFAPLAPHAARSAPAGP